MAETRLLFVQVRKFFFFSLIPSLVLFASRSVTEPPDEKTWRNKGRFRGLMLITLPAIQLGLDLGLYFIYLYINLIGKPVWRVFMESYAARSGLLHWKEILIYYSSSEYCGELINWTTWLIRYTGMKWKVIWIVWYFFWVYYSKMTFSYFII